jgi:translation initiation factor 2 beta subunit (eIF-2beta)/eIF-5
MNCEHCNYELTKEEATNVLLDLDGEFVLCPKCEKPAIEYCTP